MFEYHWIAICTRIFVLFVVDIICRESTPEINRERSCFPCVQCEVGNIIKKKTSKSLKKFPFHHA